MANSLLPDVPITTAQVATIDPIEGRHSRALQGYGGDHGPHGSSDASLNRLGAAGRLRERRLYYGITGKVAGLEEHELKPNYEVQRRAQDKGPDKPDEGLGSKNPDFDE